MTPSQYDNCCILCRPGPFGAAAIMTALVLHRHCPDPPDEGAPEGIGIPEPAVAGDLLHGYVAALEERMRGLGPCALA